MTPVQYSHKLDDGQVMLETVSLPLKTKAPEQCHGCELLIRCMGSGRLVYPYTDGHKFTYHIFVCAKCKVTILECQLGVTLGTNEVHQYWQDRLTRIPPCWNKKGVSDDIFYCDQCGHDRTGPL